MNTRTLMAAAVAAASMMTVTVSLFAAEQPSVSAARKSEPIYGYRMMSDQERNDYREKMRSARSAGERQSIRDEHRKQMQSRAKERGVTMPDTPRGPGAGIGPGAGMGPGPGMSPGAGMVPGAGMGPGGAKDPGMNPGAGMGPGAGMDPGAGMVPGAGRGPGGRP